MVEHIGAVAQPSRRGRARLRRGGLALSLAGTVAATVLTSASPARAADDHRRVVDLTFPVVGPLSVVDTYHADREGGRRLHQGVDIFAAKGTPVYAARAGRLCWITGVDSAPPSYGYTVSVCGDDGITYHYLHLNNDTPGTDDGAGGPEGAYAPGIHSGVRIARGQVLGYLGDSGNAESTPAHLHFEMEDPDLDDDRITGPRYRPDRLDPYPSLLAALARGDRPRPVALAPDQRSPAVAAWQEHLRRLGAVGLPSTGFYGPQTTAATQAFQRDRGLQPDGIAGPATMAALEALQRSHVGPLEPLPGHLRDADNSEEAASNGQRHLELTSPLQRGEDVRSFQFRLRALGYTDSAGEPLGVDGIFGSETAAAAAAFQRSVGFRPGPVGPRTLAALAEVEAREG